MLSPSLQVPDQRYVALAYQVGRADHYVSLLQRVFQPVRYCVPGNRHFYDFKFMWYSRRPSHHYGTWTCSLTVCTCSTYWLTYAQAITMRMGSKRMMVARYSLNTLRDRCLLILSVAYLGKNFLGSTLRLWKW